MGLKFLLPTSWSEARALGQPIYFTGIPCQYGHIAPRFIKGQCLVCARIAQNLWRQNNRQRVAAQMRQRRAVNPEHHRAIAKRSRFKRRKQKLIDNLNRKARLLGAAGIFTDADVQHILLQQQGLCANPFCAKDIRNCYTVDHKTPLIRGGSNWPKNLQLLCSPCNSGKHAKTQAEWLEYLTRRNVR